MMRALLSTLLVICVLAGSMAIVPRQACAASTDCPQTDLPKPAKNVSQFEIGICANRFNTGAFRDYELTSKIVACIQGTIRQTTLQMMMVVANQFGWVTAVLGTLIIIFHGVRIATGEQEIVKKSMMLILKIAFVVGFMNMLPQVVDWTFSAMQQLLILVAGGMTPWQQIDNFMGNLFGFGPTIVLLNGVLGLVAAAAFSSNIGITMLFSGVIAILNLLTFLMSLIYTYCISFLTIAFLLVLTPVMIPMALFFHTERYFRKWVDIMAGAILTPALIFAFLRMFLGIFDILINNIFSILGGNDFRAYWRMNTSLSSWLMRADPNANMMLKNLPTQGDVDCTARAIKTAVQTNIDPLKANAFDQVMARVPTLNFGANDYAVIQQLTFAFAMLWVFSMMMKAMVRMLPDVAASIASLLYTRMSAAGSGHVVEGMQGGINKLQQGLEKGGTGSVKNMLGRAEELKKYMGTMASKRDK